MKSVPPGEILEEVGTQEILNRCKFYHRIFYHIRDKWPNLFLDPYILRNAVESYYVDLLRIKPFHEIGLADQHKRGAFTLKWIAKLRPIYWHPPEDSDIIPTKAILMANEVYAIYLALSHMELETENIPEPIWKNLLYTLHYHSPNVDELATIFYLIEEVVCHKKEAAACKFAADNLSKILKARPKK